MCGAAGTWQQPLWMPHRRQMVKASVTGKIGRVACWQAIVREQLYICEIGEYCLQESRTKGHVDSPPGGLSSRGVGNVQSSLGFSCSSLGLCQALRQGLIWA